MIQMRMELLELGEFAVKKALDLGADEAEAFLVQGRELTVKAENNEIKLATSHSKGGLGLRVFTGKALGFASVNILDEGKIDEATRAAVSLSRTSPRDEHNLLPEPEPLVEVPGLYDEQAEGFELDRAISQVEEMLETAKGYDPRVTVDMALFNATIEQRAVVSSKGIEAEEQGSLFTYFIFGMARDGEEVSSFNYRFDSTRKVEEIDVEGMARKFADHVVASLGAGKGESFTGTVVLSPNAVHELLMGPIVWAINANNVQKGMSKWAGMIGKQVASSLFTLEDNGLMEGGAGSRAFDREGLPPEPLTIIEEGALRSFLYNSYTARKEGRSSTGHASGGTREVPGIGPTNLIIRPGDVSKDDLISEVKRGVLVTRFSGFPKPMSGDFSGVVKGGFLIEDGKLTRPLVETLISGNIFELLPKVSGVSRETERIGFPSEIALVAPYIRLEEVSITGS